MTATIRIAIADDHPIVLDGLEQLFKLERDFELVGRCVDGEEAIALIRDKSPEVIVLDLRMPRRSGLSIIREVQLDRLPTKVVLLTAALDDDEVLEAVRLGVKGLVLKEMAPRILVHCIREVAAGREWLEKETVTRAMSKLVKREGRHPSPLLTPRESEIVNMVASGLRNKEIASRLTISEGTVKIHLHSIYEKLQVSGRLELSVYARDNGLLAR
jgi:DNA-binding NarL/FixJ family response regulator